MTSLTGDVHDLRFRVRLGNPGSAEACPCRGCEEVLGVLDGSCADKCVVFEGVQRLCRSVKYML